jgi:type VI secretion system protein ImpA
VQLTPNSSKTEERTANEDQTATVSGTVKDASPPHSGEIRTREDAVRMLEKICDFIERTEPANPAPLFIRRGQRLMTKNFVEIMQDLVPDSLNQIKQITGLESKKS